MKTLLLVAHGSRRDRSNQEIRKLAENIKKMTQQFDIVDACFLEIADPSIPLGIERLVKQGAKEILVLPYFLAAGRHVAEDIPAQVLALQQQYPETRIAITSHLGEFHHMARVILDLAGESAF